MSERDEETPRDVDAEHEEPELAERATSRRDTLLTRGEAATILGRHESSVRRLEKKSQLVAEVGADGVHRFRERHVRELAVELRAHVAEPPPEAYDASMASEAFAAFDAGTHPVEVVKKTRWDPRAVEAMHRQWVAMRGGYVVTADEARAIASLPWLMGSRPICSGADLVKNLRASMAHGRCQRCAEQGIDGPAEVCADCARALSAKEAERRLAAARALRAGVQARRGWEDAESDLRMKLGRTKRATSTSA
jgi:hypothetical protein